MLLVCVISWLILALTEASHASTVDHFPALVLSASFAPPDDHSVLPLANGSHWVTQSTWDTQSVSLAASTADLFANPYGFSSLKKFEGDDGNSLLGSTVMFFDEYVAVSALGYGKLPAALLPFRVPASCPRPPAPPPLRASHCHSSPLLTPADPFIQACSRDWSTSTNPSIWTHGSPLPRSLRLWLISVPLVRRWPTLTPPC